MRRQIFFIWIFIITGIFFSFETQAQTSLSAKVIANGSVVTTGSHQITGTIGQPIAGTSSRISSGFWYSSGSILTSIEEITMDDLPKEYMLYQNYPNPFNPSTTIEYALKKESKVRLEIYNTLGQVIKIVVDELQSAGKYRVTINMKDISSGVYMYTIKVGDFIDSRKMILLK